MDEQRIRGTMVNLLLALAHLVVLGLVMFLSYNSSKVHQPKGKILTGSKSRHSNKKCAL